MNLDDIPKYEFVMAERVENRTFILAYPELFELIDGELWETEITPRPENE